MKKLSKIIVGAVLSVAMVVTGGIAALTMSNSYAATSSVKVVGGVTSSNGTVEYGTFKQASGNEVTGVNLSGVKGSTFNLGTINVNDTYFDDTWSYTKGSGISCSKVDGTIYNGTDQAFTGASADTRSFISIIFNPANGYRQSSNTEYFQVTLTEKNKPENFVTYHVSSYYESAENSYELAIKCSATNNGTYAERFRSAGIRFDQDVRRVMGLTATGGHTEALKLYYDFSQQSAYTNVAFRSGFDGIYKAFKIRDFDAVSETSNYQSIPGDVKLWAGFSENADLDVTLTFTNTFSTDDDSMSIILTSLGGTSFATSTLQAKQNVDVVAGVDVDLTGFLYYKSSLVEYEYTANEDVTVQVDGTPISGTTYAFTQDAVVTFYDAENNPIGTTSVSVVDEFDYETIATNGTVEHYRGGSKVDAPEKIKIGDVIRFIAGKNSQTGVVYDELNSAYLNGTAINEDSFVKGEGYYEYTVKPTDIVGGKVNVSVVLDKLCDITYIDEYATQTTTVTKISAISGSYKLPATAAAGAIVKGNSTDKVLLGYIREDLTYDTDKKMYVREDYPEYAHEAIDGGNVKSLSNFYGSKSGNATISNNNYEYGALFMPMPGMVFRAVYASATYSTEVRFEDNVPKVYIKYSIDAEPIDKVNSLSTNLETNESLVQTKVNITPRAFASVVTSESEITSNHVTGTIGTNKVEVTKWTKNGDKYEVRIEIPAGEMIASSLHFGSANVSQNSGDNNKGGNFGVSAMIIKPFKASTSNEVATAMYNKYVAVGGANKYKFYNADGDLCSSDYTLDHVNALATLLGKATFTEQPV